MPTKSYPSATIDTLATYVVQANSWLHKRTRYQNVVVKLISTASQENFKAEFVVKDGIHYIYLYRDSMISFYNRHASCISSFNLFFISILVHELTHRRQYYSEGKKNFKYFKAIYSKDKNRFECPAIQNEIRFTNYIVCGRLPSLEIDRFYI